MRHALLAPLGASLVLASLAPARAQRDGQLPVREVTVFKDGHAFVNRQGTVRAGNGGAVLLADLPNPVLGTFWPYAATKGVTLKSVTARLQNVPVERDAVTIVDYLRANIGRRVEIRRGIPPTQEVLNGTLVSVLPEPGLPDPSLPVLTAAPGYPGAGFRPSGFAGAEGVTALLKTDQGLFPIPIVGISGVVLPADGRTRLTENQQRNELFLDLTGATAGQSVEVGLMYLQRGVRWIPHYRVSLDGKGTAQVQFQATVVNDLMDLDNSLVNLVVGVPTFLFKDEPDPIGLQDTFARLSRYFGADSNTGNNFSNAIMGQAAGGFGAPGMGVGVGPDLGQQPPRPLVSDAERNEDLYLFPVRGVTLKKGQRMTLPVADFAIPYEDVYTLEIPATPLNLPDGDLPPDLARLLVQPKVQKQIRLKNNSPYPLTTAPALLLNGKSVLAQGMMRYTPRNAVSDLPLTVGVNVLAVREDKEASRKPQAVRYNGVDLTEVAVNGSVSVTNFDKTPVSLEVTRYVVGTVTGANSNGKVEALNPLTERDTLLPRTVRGYYGDTRHNGLGRITWRVALAPGQTVTLTTDWKYLQ